MQFIEGDINDPAPGGPFDAIVERLALWAVSDPAALLRRQATVLRPGGLVVPIEIDLSTMRSLPETAFIIQVKAQRRELVPMLARRTRAVHDFLAINEFGPRALDRPMGRRSRTSVAGRHRLHSRPRSLLGRCAAHLILHTRAALAARGAAVRIGSGWTNLPT